MTNDLQTDVAGKRPALPRIRVIDKRSYPFSREPKVNSTQGNHYALDNICHTAGALAARFGQFLHPGRIHSHSARARDCNPDHQPPQRTPRTLTR
jgi:hypothetical protein